MKWMLDISIPEPERKLTYDDTLLLIGSCFTANVGKALEELKFRTLYNPTGILFDPLSVARHLQDYTQKKVYQPHDLFELNSIWNSWQHHSSFSSTDRMKSLELINSSIEKAHQHLQESNMLLITLGTAFSYRHQPDNIPVANCHKAPAAAFIKHLLKVEEIVNALKPVIQPLLESNKNLQVVFTISPVRHIRDGVIENNRSKARLIEAVHQLVEENERLLYFPSYEIVIDVLRDYRFYDADLVHPNYAATQHVFDLFCKHYMDKGTLNLMEDVYKLVLAKNHKPQHPDSTAHQQFRKVQKQKLEDLKSKLPQLNWEEEEEGLST
jgi:hypothetical protein